MSATLKISKTKALKRKTKESLNRELYDALTAAADLLEGIEAEMLDGKFRGALGSSDERKMSHELGVAICELRNGIADVFRFAQPVSNALQTLNALLGK
jgi:hypothetical protein